MTIPFYKYQGTGNDFVIIDNRHYLVNKNDTKRIARLCDRKFGIGADGLMFLEESKDAEFDFKMVYFNADGREGSMCGNGGRCLVAFAKFLGIIEKTTKFIAVDGAHTASIKDDIVALAMNDIQKIENHGTHYFLDTGSPHHVMLVKNLTNYDVIGDGRKIRNAAPYFHQGSNVNFVEKESEDSFSVRTYERGVEDETLSCGTGVTAVALAMHADQKTMNDQITINTRGGTLKVTFKKTEKGYEQIYLIGSAQQVFKGEVIW